jgi:hypothetical protein
MWNWKIVSRLVTLTGLLSSAEALELSQPNPSPEAREVFHVIQQYYQNGLMLSGQQESTWVNDNPDDEMEYIQEHTGRLSAIRGMDYIDNDFDGVTSRAMQWWRDGGIPSICWHWGAPTRGLGYDASKIKIDIEEALREGTELNRALMADMDRVALELKKLRDANVPVLWRPFHEFNGKWFWWGKAGPDAFIALWRLMYDRYVNYHGLNNLIWVLGYTSNPKPKWYPGDAFVDIVGADNYHKGTQHKMFLKLLEIAGDERPLCYHENGPLPNPDAMQEDGTRWVWFLTWHTIHLKKQNTPEYVRFVYQHPRVITRDELPK